MLVTRSPTIPSLCDALLKIYRALWRAYCAPTSSRYRLSSRGFFLNEPCRHAAKRGEEDEGRHARVGKKGGNEHFAVALHLWGTLRLTCTQPGGSSNHLGIYYLFSRETLCVRPSSSHSLLLLLPQFLLFHPNEPRLESVFCAELLLAAQRSLVFLFNKKEKRKNKNSRKER